MEKKMKSFLKFLILALLLASFVAACTGTNSQIASKEYVLTTELKDGNLVFLGVSDEINGQANPTLSAERGETITVTLINGGMGQHDITFPKAKVSTGVVREKGEEASVTFTVPATAGQLEYYDSVSNHAELGMKGVLSIGAQSASADQAILPAQGSVDPNQAVVFTAFEKGACATCHTIPGIPNAKGALGPNLGNIVFSAQEYLDSGKYTGTAKKPRRIYP